MSDILNQQGFGTFKGVYIPNVLQMLGVIVYLRLGYVTGQVGLPSMSVIIGISLTLMAITGFSITSIVTNMRVGGGGTYYIVSRTLGINIGASLGLLLYTSQIISIAMCISGFALSFHDLYPQFGLAHISAATLATLTLLAFVSSDLTLKTQTLIFVILTASFIAVFTGSMANVTTPMPTAQPGGMSFWQAFAIFYPAVTGIEAGMAMSGTLRNPSRSLAVGTLTSLATCGALYLGLAAFLSLKIPAAMLVGNPLVVQEFASVRQLIILGIWGATLSSALGGILSAPRMLQAVAEDGVLPRILARTYGARQEPRVALLLSSVVAMVLVFTTQMDQIIPILTMVCLIGYGTLNLVAGFADLLHHPSWRPAFKTPWYVAFSGFAACLMVMLMVDTVATFISLGLLTTVYICVARRNIKVQFQDVRESIFLYLARKTLYRLTTRLQHAKNWHLNLLVFTPSPSTHRDFVHFAAGLTHRTGILTFATFLPESWRHGYRLEASEKTLSDFFSRDKVPCLVEVNATPNVAEGMHSFVQAYGLGPLQPNTVALSQPTAPEQSEQLFGLLENAAGRGKNIVLFRGAPEEGESGGVFAPRNGARPRQIEIWWGGAYRNNFSLMLYMAKALLSADRFKDARLVIKTAVYDTNAHATLSAYLSEFVVKHRLNADYDVLMCESGKALDTLTRHASGSDLVFMGLKPFDRVQGDGAYAAYYAELTEKLTPLRNIALVAASEAVTFKEMFQD